MKCTFYNKDKDSSPILNSLLHLKMLQPLYKPHYSIRAFELQLSASILVNTPIMEKNAFFALEQSNIKFHVYCEGSISVLEQYNHAKKRKLECVLSFYCRILFQFAQLRMGKPPPKANGKYFVIFSLCILSTESLFTEFSCWVWF